MIFKFTNVTQGNKGLRVKKSQVGEFITSCMALKGKTFPNKCQSLLSKVSFLKLHEPEFQVLCIRYSSAYVVVICANETHLPLTNVNENSKRLNVK